MVESVVWALVILAVVGLAGQSLTRLRRPSVRPLTHEPQPVEIGDVGRQWIQVVKVLRDHSVIERPRDLPRNGFPVVVDVPPDETDAVVRGLTGLGVAARRVSS